MANLCHFNPEFQSISGAQLLSNDCPRTEGQGFLLVIHADCPGTYPILQLQVLLKEIRDIRPRASQSIASSANHSKLHLIRLAIKLRLSFKQVSLL